jgi:hypothetical protein
MSLDDGTLTAASGEQLNAFSSRGSNTHDVMTGGCEHSGKLVGRQDIIVNDQKAHDPTLQPMAATPREVAASKVRTTGLNFNSQLCVRTHIL